MKNIVQIIFFSLFALSLNAQVDAPSGGGTGVGDGFVAVAPTGDSLFTFSGDGMPVDTFLGGGDNGVSLVSGGIAGTPIVSGDLLAIDTLNGSIYYPKGDVWNLFGVVGAAVNIADLGDFYQSTTVEGALQEIGAKLNQANCEFGINYVDIGVIPLYNVVAATGGAWVAGDTLNNLPKGVIIKVISSDSVDVLTCGCKRFDTPHGLAIGDYFAEGSQGNVTTTAPNASVPVYEVVDANTICASFLRPSNQNTGMTINCPPGNGSIFQTSYPVTFGQPNFYDVSLNGDVCDDGSPMVYTMIENTDFDSCFVTLNSDGSMMLTEAVNTFSTRQVWQNAGYCNGGLVGIAYDTFYVAGAVIPPSTATLILSQSTNTVNGNALVIEQSGTEDGIAIPETTAATYSTNITLHNAQTGALEYTLVRVFGTATSAPSFDWSVSTTGATAAQQATIEASFGGTIGTAANGNGVAVDKEVTHNTLYAQLQPNDCSGWHWEIGQMQEQNM